MLVRFGHVFLVLALLATVGGHWALLQTVAWSNMLAKNLQTASLTEALTKTFDGNHPCDLCKKISAGKKAEKQSELPKLGKKLEFTCERPLLVLSPPTSFYLLNQPTERLAARRDSPPTPPPLCA